MTLPLFLIPIIAGLIAQGLKHGLNKEWKMFKAEEGYLPRYGGMPSAHTAFVFALSTVVLVAAGWNSAAFAIVASLTIFVLDDALRMRIFLEHHARALKKLVRRLPDEDEKDFPQLQTHLGHEPAEVTAGAVLGVTVALVLLWVGGHF